MMDNVQNAYILEQEPLRGCMPDDVRQWLTENSSEECLADALALVSNKAGVLSHAIGISDVWLDEAFDKWSDLARELQSKVIAILGEENKNFSASPKAFGKGSRYAVLPFMERSGYRDSAGWWIRC